MDPVKQYIGILNDADVPSAHPDLIKIKRQLANILNGRSIESFSQEEKDNYLKISNGAYRAHPPRPPPNQITPKNAYENIFKEQAMKYRKKFIDMMTTDELGGVSRDRVTDKQIANSSAIKMLEFAVTIERLYLTLRAHISDWLTARHSTDALGGRRCYMDVVMLSTDPHWILGRPLIIETLSSHPIYDKLMSSPTAISGVRQLIQQYKHINDILYTPDIIRRLDGRNDNTFEEAVQFLAGSTTKAKLIHEYTQHILCLVYYQSVLEKMADTGIKNGVSYINVSLNQCSHPGIDKCNSGHSVVLIQDFRTNRPHPDQPYDIEYFDPNGYVPPSKLHGPFHDKLEDIPVVLQEKYEYSENTYFDYSGITTLLKRFLGRAPLNFSGNLINVSLDYHTAADTLNRDFKVLNFRPEEFKVPGIQTERIKHFEQGICALYCSWYIVQRARSNESVGDIGKFMRDFYKSPTNHYIILGFAYDVLSSLQLIDGRTPISAWDALINTYRSTDKTNTIKQLQFRSLHKIKNIFASDVFNIQPELDDAIQLIMYDTNAINLVNRIIGPHINDILRVLSMPPVNIPKTELEQLKWSKRKLISNGYKPNELDEINERIAELEDINKRTADLKEFVMTERQQLEIIQNKIAKYNAAPTPAAREEINNIFAALALKDVRLEKYGDYLKLTKAEIGGCVVM